MSLPLSSALALILRKIAEQPPQSQAEALRRLTQDSGSERDRDVLAKRERRSEAARIVIPDCANPTRRELCLQDPERFLRTYFADRYRRPFGPHHLAMIEAINARARHGGRQAIAAPRGCGKSELVKGLLVYLVLAGLVRFPLPVAATTAHAGNLYGDFRRKLSTNDLLLEDFPEVCFPVRALDGAPQRAAKQHIEGVLTQIVWTADDYLSLPIVPGSQYGGVKMAYFGLDAAFRGVNKDGCRPDFVLIDDPETRESAHSLKQIEDRERILDQDIAGLEEEGHTLTILVLTTIQNRYCLSYRLTDPKVKPAWNGKRYGAIVSWPERMDLWEDYVARRRAAQTDGDEHGMAAVDFYLENREEMDRGAVMLSDYHEPEILDDGRQVTYSALQLAWNKITDTSLSAYKTEYQNDPDPEEAPEAIGLTAARVQSRLTKLPQFDLPSTTTVRTMALDPGKNYGHWVDIGWEGDAIGTIPDYGVAEAYGLTNASSQQAIERAILVMLETWADEVVASRNPGLVLIDSGTYSEAVYEFCRRKGRPFYPSKGWDARRFRIPARTEEKVPFLDAYAARQTERGVWLYNVNTEAWKQWTQERFNTPTFQDSGERNPGSLALYDPGQNRRQHNTYAHHITAEEVQWQPVPGREARKVLVVKNRNNHWLDATALACAAAGILGIRVVPIHHQPAPIVKRTAAPQTAGLTDPWGRPFVNLNR